MKVHIGVDKDSGLVHSVVTTAANVHGLTSVADLLHGEEKVVDADAGYQGIAKGPDMADHEIAARVSVGDLVITADIPLASEVLEKGARVVTPRGERYTENNIRQRLQMRDFMETMRASGEHTGGPPPLNQADRKTFADQLDRLLTQATRSTAQQQ